MTLRADPLKLSSGPLPGRPALRHAAGLAAAALVVPMLAGSAWAQLDRSANPAAEAGIPAANAATAAGPSDAGPGGAPPAVAAATATPPAPASGATGDQAVRVLLEQANFWRKQYQPDRALTALNRALRLAPDNPDTLSLLAQIQAERGDRTAAQGAANHLHQVAPNSPDLGTIDQALRMGPLNQDALAQARAFARDGHTAEAVAAYQRVFHGTTPPANMAVEYYQTLSGTEGGWEQARDGLGRAVIADPRDLQAQLAYAQVLTYRQQTRAEGILRLQSLAASPATAAAAQRSLHQALLWLPDQPASAAPLQTYLQLHPNDAQLQQKLQTAQNPPQTGPVDVVGQLRVTGWADLNSGKLDEAAAQFEDALKQTPTDADALGGLGLVRLRQGRTGEGRALLQRAIAADPSKRGSWEAALNGSNATVQWGEVKSLAARGDSAGAERLLKRLMGRSPNAGTLQLLGDLQQRNRELADAEASYRQALALQPGNGPGNASIMLSLAGVLQREGNQAEADRLFAQAETTGNRALIGRARADELRQRAEAVSDPVAQAGLYRAALAQDPANPWLRLGLARALVKQGRTTEAQALVQEGISGPRPAAEALEAAVYFYQETNNTEAAAATIARLPARSRTPEMRALQAQIDFRNQLRVAVLSGDRAAVRMRLLAMAASPDPDGSRGAAIARALVGIGDRTGAREAIVTAIAAARNPTPAQRIAYAGALMDAGQVGDAYQLVSSVDAGRLPPAEAQAAQSLRAGIAVRSSDTLNRAGKTADAYDQLAPALDATPASPDLNMALARLYQTNREPGRALAINAALLQRDPNNLEVRQAAVGAAIASGSWSLAGQWVREGLRLFPNDPRAYMAAADLARAQGDRGVALRYLETARQLRQQQLSFRDYMAPLVARAEDTAGGGAISRIAGAEPAAFVTDEPFAPAAEQPGDPMPGAAPPPFLRRSFYQRPAVPTDAGTALALGNTPGTLDAVPADLRSGAAAVNGGAVEIAQAAPYQPTPYLPPAQPGAGYAFRPPPPGSNPFRAASLENNPDLPPSLGGTGPGFVAARPIDPLTQELNSQIAALHNDLAPTAQAGVDARFRSGTAGLDQLTEAMVPLEATFAPGGVGTLKIQATPTFLTAGNIGSNPQTLSTYGAGATYALSPNTPSPGTVDASGVGLDLGYNWQWLNADVGTSPLGFRVSHVIGGLEVAPEIANDLRLRLTGENRSVTDSVLSYAGTKDAVTGTIWGGVERTRGHVQLEYAPGLANFYIGAGGASLTGQHVQSNTEVEAGIGGSFGFYKTSTEEARAGLDLVYFGYDHNERFFTLGGGGYFSPQNYFAAIIPVSYTHKDDLLSWTLGASAGLETYKEASNVYFPIDPGLQAQLQSLAATNTSLAYATPSHTTTGVVGGLNGAVEYKATPQLSVGARASYQRAGDWNEAEGLLYARYIFNGAY